MREIKFRAWDNKLSKYDDVNFDIEDILLNIETGSLWTLSREIHNTPNVEISALKDGRFILEQYTGLKDKNGREIYEGDIVYNDADKYNYEIIWDNKHACWSLGEDGHPVNKYRLSDFWKIIGNIHKNSELLESNK